MKKSQDMMGRWGVDEKAGRSSPGGAGYAPVVNTTLAPALRTFSIRSFVIQILCEKQDINI
jgi:hypothetical protein